MLIYAFLGRSDVKYLTSTDVKYFDVGRRQIFFRFFFSGFLCPGDQSRLLVYANLCVIRAFWRQIFDVSRRQIFWRRMTSNYFSTNSNLVHAYKHLAYKTSKHIWSPWVQKAREKKSKKKNWRRPTSKYLTSADVKYLTSERPKNA